MKRSRKRSSRAGSRKMERVGDRTKWRDIVRQAKAHNGLWRQWKKNKKRRKRKKRKKKKRRKRKKEECTILIHL
jgi:hypothetical protein